MTVKDNQPLLHTKLRLFFTGSGLFGALFQQAKTQELSHGRIETRQITLSADLPPGYTGFPDVKQVFCLTRQVVSKKTGVIREQSVYGLTSLSPAQAGPTRLLGLLRGHWQIENRSHWVRDVTFDEDRSQVRKGSIPQVMAALRNAVINLLRVQGFSNIASACRYHAARPEAALELMGMPKTE